MARVPEAELERIKAGVSVERLAEGRGIALRRHGADLLGLCPFHEDREPSLVISPAKNLWHCLGACQAGGSCIDWVMRAEGVSFRHAVELLRSDLPFAAATPAGIPAKVSTVRRLPAPVDGSGADQELLAQVVAFYHRTLTESPEAMAYLESRGLADAEAISHFQIGFANRTLGLRLPPKTTVAGGEVRNRLQALGIVRPSGHEHFNGSVVVPVIGGDGGVAEMYGRKITRSLRAGTPDHLYLPGPHRGVWNAGGLAGATEVILCEALLDALTFWVHGLRNVTAAYGIEGFTQEHMDALTGTSVGRVYIAYDRDAAGDRAAVQLADRLAAAGIETFRVQFPRDLDANAFAGLEPGTAGDRLHAVVRRAVWLGPGTRPADAATQRTADAPEESGQGEGFSGRDTPSAPPPFAAASAAASAAPSPASPPIEVTEDEVTLTFGERRWRVRGLAKVTTDDVLKVNLLLRAADDRFHVDSLDLYAAKHRQAYAALAATETGVQEETVRRDLGRVLLALEACIAERRKREPASAPTGAEALSPEDRAAAMTLLRDPGLLDHVVAAYDHIGVVGEATNKLVAYLAATSRLLERPLAVVMQSSSAAGKSSLLEATMTLLPETARVKYSAMTGQSLYYMAERELAHKVLAVVEEAGADRAAYALKLLQSEGELSIASTGKDPQTGRLVTHDYTVKGPVALFLTTTAIDVDEELMNRCLVLAVDEDREQTRAIHVRQRERETLQGLLLDQERQQTIRLHRAAQTLLRPLHVVNPYAPQLTFSDQRTRTRRDHDKYLTLIRTVALLHQHQREVKRAHAGGAELEYIEVIPSDIEVANRLADEVLGRSLDELPPQTRRLLVLLDELVTRRMREQGFTTRDEVRLTRKEIREHIGWGNSQLAVHLDRLCGLEYVTSHVAGNGRRHVYEVVWNGADGHVVPALGGLIDAETLTYDGNLPGSEVNLPATFRGASGPLPATFRGVDTVPNPNGHQGFPIPLAAEAGNHVKGENHDFRRIVGASSAAAG